MDSNKPRPIDPQVRIGHVHLKVLGRPGGAIWRIFWLHLQHPTQFPIYDQHVHRAMAFLLKWSALELPVTNPQKVRYYLEHYRPFFRSFHEFPHRQADRALWAFGRFLNSDYGSLLTGAVRPPSLDTSGRENTPNADD